MLPNLKKISIILPVYNEEKTVIKVLDLVKKSDTFSLVKEIIVINDNSNDKTLFLLKEYKKKTDIKILNNSVNSGKGACLKKGILSSTGDIVIIQDADLEYSPRDYPILIKPLLEGYADVVFGSRFLNSNPHRVLYFYHYLANKFVTTLSNLFTNLNLTDIEAGYKVFKGNIVRKIAPRLQSQRFGFEPEIIARLSKIKNIRIYEVGISYFGRTYQEGKKISTIDGIKAVFEIIKYGLFS